eukprot:TRINITY_DN1015_c3_g1_i1.p1 TRINITY_DN1015_c3_g1~~TRINITY_DN1015_c3_g1_i1.p1  ORF type:complete len:795 (+),score=157.24 TRINITY_DN1015_c3_g1_i1:52-2385(+)
MAKDDSSPRALGVLSPGKISYQEVKEHNKAGDCWMIICGKVYDLTDFAKEHPGGEGVVTEQAGLNATDAFLHAHPESIMTLTLGVEGLAKCYKGDVDMATVPDSAVKKPSSQSAPAKELSADEIPPIEAVLNLHDFEAIAQKKMHLTGKKQAWDYYSSGADDELTYNENVNVFQRIWLKPRVMVNVKDVQTKQTMLGFDSDFPVYLSAVAMCGMGHEDGECAWMRAAASAKVPFMIPNLSSKSFADITGASAEGQKSWFQIYVNPDKNVVKAQLEDLKKKDIKALCITVDSAVPGKRERDLRNKIAMTLGQQAQQQSAAKDAKPRKAGNYANRDPSLNWEDLEWFKENTDIPLVLKGVQCADDAVEAANRGCKGIILSNHGGRNLDTSRSGIEILPEVMSALREAGIPKTFEVYIDGGIRRGTDIVKALCLGATGVGLGKPAVYSMSAYGDEGVAKMLSVLKDEFIKAMQLIGAASISDLRPTMIDIDSLKRHTDVAPIPASPYAGVPNLKNVRSPGVPEPKTREQLASEIAKLQSQLDSMGGTSKTIDFPLFLKSLFSFAMPTACAAPNNVSAVLHRSAVLLILYVLVHTIANCGVFLGADTSNLIRHHIRNSPVHFITEKIILGGFLIHAAAAIYLSRAKLTFIMNNPRTGGKLFFSGGLITVFTLAHVYQFSWNDEIRTYNVGGLEVRDVYLANLQLFQDPVQVAFYIASFVALMVHLKHGWPKTVLKMSLSDQKRKVLTATGSKVFFPLIAAMVASILFLAFQAMNGVAASGV